MPGLGLFSGFVEEKEGIEGTSGTSSNSVQSLKFLRETKRNIARDLYCSSFSSKSWLDERGSTFYI